jgi:hypothetical protein
VTALLVYTNSSTTSSIVHIVHSIDVSTFGNYNGHSLRCGELTIAFIPCCSADTSIIIPLTTGG